MFGIFLESVAILRSYAGSGYLLALYAAAFLYLLCTEKDRGRRFLLLYVPLVILAGFLFPFSRVVYVALMDEGATYYRLLWMLPVSITVAYAGACAGKRHPCIGLVLCALAIALAGRLVYRSVNISRAENAYHLPQRVIDLCDAVLPEDGEERVCAAFPDEMVHFVRQYDTRIELVYGRDMIEPVWDYWHPVHLVLEEEVPDTGALCAALNEARCEVLILAEDRVLSEPLSDYGFEEERRMHGYVIYRNKHVG